MARFFASHARRARPARNGERPRSCLSPAGNARLKARALGEKGRQAVRDYLAEGGRYLGFCGGAGLALSQHRSQDGLGLCPWGRAPYPERLHHLISGHAHMRVRSCMARDLPAVRPDFPKAFPDRGCSRSAAPAAGRRGVRPGAAALARLRPRP